MCSSAPGVVLPASCFPRGQSVVWSPVALPFVGVMQSVPRAVSSILHRAVMSLAGVPRAVAQRWKYITLSLGSS